MAAYFAIALLGAESTGKTSLAQQLQSCFLLAGYRVFLQPELLRSWCEENQTTPNQQDQHFLLAQQIKTQTDWLKKIHLDLKNQNSIFIGLPQNHLPLIFISDTTGLQTAAYSHYYFADISLDEQALIAQDFFNFSLLMGLDLPWQQDPLRTGPASQTAVDSRLRQLLSRIPRKESFSTVYGNQHQRLINAWTSIQKQKSFAGLLPDWSGMMKLAQANSQSIDNLLDPCFKNTSRGAVRNTQHLENGLKRWGHFCENCADADCEKKLFSLLKPCL
jgi:nicotinamide riboside kinase